MDNDSGDIKLPDLISTFVINGFHINKIFRYAKANILNLYKLDKLGAEIRYSVLFTDETEESPLIDTVLKTSKSYNSTPLIICDSCITDKCKIYTKSDFFDFFGGIVNTGLILIPNLPLILNDLGLNKLPEGLEGVPNVLLEIYCKECLQFILESPTRRYGKDRSFESLPDGLVIGKNRFMILFDSKAYSVKKKEKGFKFELDDIKRFASYVSDFNKRYGFYLGGVFSFLVISGDFDDSESSISERSNELYKMCNCRLTCIKSEELGKIVEFLKLNPSIRSSIIWENIFTNLIVNLKTIDKEIKRIKDDNLV